MLRIAELTGRKVLVHKKTKTAKDGTTTEKYQKLGKVHNAVFYPDGRRVAGLMVKRPDVVGMVKRADAFLAWDSFAISDDGSLQVSDTEAPLDDGAIRRLGLNWDACIIWSGMDARTTTGKSLGYVSDAEVDERTGRVTRFLTTDGGAARALIGSFVITPDMVRGYSNGCMVIDSGDRTVELDGGLAGAAGEGYARAKAGASKVGKQVGAAAGRAVDKGSFALGKALGKAKRAVADATADEEQPSPAPAVPAVPAADVRVEKPVERLAEKSADPAAAPARPAPKTYAPAPKQAQKPAAKKPATKPAAKKPAPKPATSGDKVARAAGKQLSSFGKMFGDFKSEFDKASKG